MRLVFLVCSSDFLFLPDSRSENFNQRLPNPVPPTKPLNWYKGIHVDFSPFQISQNVATPNYTTQRQYQQTQRQRSLNSPGTPASRQNSFPGQETGFPGPPSPTTASPYTTGNVFTNPPQMRMQRQSSIPQGAQHLPGN